MSLQPPGVPVFYPGYSPTQQFNSGMDGSGGIRDTFNFLNNKPKFRARRVAAQTINESVYNAIVWDTVDFDSANGWGPNQSPAQSADKYVVQAPGWYLITARVSLFGTGAANLVLIPGIVINGQSPIGIGQPGWEGPEVYVPTGASSVPKCVNCAWEVYCPPAATVQLNLFFSSESTITATDTTVGFQPSIALVWSGR